MIKAVFSSFFENTVHELRSIRSLILTTPVLIVGAPIPFIVGDRPPHTGRTALIVAGLTYLREPIVSKALERKLREWTIVNTLEALDSKFILTKALTKL